MKTTDYMYRSGLIETFLCEQKMTGVEIGVDVGAHAHSMLVNCDIETLYLVDLWDRDFNYGYCVGRLESGGFRSNVGFIRKDSLKASQDKPDDELHLIYFNETNN